MIYAGCPAEYLRGLATVAAVKLREHQNWQHLCSVVFRRFEVNASWRSLTESPLLDCSREPEQGKNWRSSVRSQGPRKRSDKPRDVEIIRNILAELPEIEREVLTRFYLSQQSAQTICQELRLSNARFLEIKSRLRELYQKARYRQFSAKSDS